MDIDFSNYDILVVDDVNLNLIVVQKMLSKFKFRTRAAGNGALAMQAIREQRPDLVLLDLMMPVMDGFEVISALRSDPVTAGIPVVVLSALNSNEDIVRAYQLGANDFITKPVLMEKLINSVATQIQLLEVQKNNDQN